MSNNLRKFVSPKFTRTIDPELIVRLFERHRHLLGTFDLHALRGDASAARDALEAFFAGPEEHCPEGLVADLHRIAELGTAQGLRLLLAQAARLRIVIAPETHAGDADRRMDPKHVALRAFLDHPKVFDAASDMLALTARSSLAEFAGLHEGVLPDMSDGARAAFEAAAAKMFEADHCGRYCRVGWYDDADTVNLVLTHGSIVRTAAILRGDEERLVSYRAAENAVLSYSAATGRIKVGGGTRLRRSALSELFADKMLGRSGFFAGPDAQNLYTLAPIERTGCGFAFQHGFDPAIRKVRIVEAQAVLIDGTPQRVPSQPFNLLALLAQAVRDGRGPVRNRAIEDTTGRDARDLVRELRHALSAGRPNGSELRDWIEARRSLGAFELVLEREEIEVAP